MIRLEYCQMNLADVVVDRTTYTDSIFNIKVAKLLTWSLVVAKVPYTICTCYVSFVK